VCVMDETVQNGVGVGGIADQGVAGLPHACGCRRRQSTGKEVVLRLSLMEIRLSKIEDHIGLVKA
jgi:hypothetical protein